MKTLKDIGQTTHKINECFSKMRRVGSICALAALVTTLIIPVQSAYAAQVQVVSVTASADDGNVAANTLDGSLATRWSAQGDGQWIRFELGSITSIGAAKIAWHRGNERVARFDVQTSADAASWTTVASGVSSGTTQNLESYDVTDSMGRYVRIVGHGNNLNTWNSITEVVIDGATGTTTTPPPTTTTPPPAGESLLPVSSVTASSSDGLNVPANALDKNLATRWSALGEGQWIRFDLGARRTVTSAKIAWYKGVQRRTQFEVQTSSDGSTWSTVFSGASTGSTIALESYNLNDSGGRYVRIVCHGSNLNLWNSITEVEILGGPSDGTVTPPPPPPVTPPPPPVTPPPPPNTTLPTIKKTFTTLQIGNGKMPYYCNRPINVYDPRVTRAIIVVHGSGANASGYFDRINNVIPSNWSGKVMVIAPHFQDQTEAASGQYWWDGDWREGGASGGISSYTVVDKMVELLRNGTFPNLKWIVIGGHSAGGQFSQRYAAFTDIDVKTTPNSQYVKFVPANPSSYVYLNEYRPGPNNTWIVPAECSSGDGYNEWKYGLEGLYGYSAARGANWARAHLPRCWVELLAGTFDNVVDDGLDLDCAAMRQGERRFDRAQNFNAFMDRFYPNNNFSMTLVPEVGHDSELIFASPEGKNAYFFAD